MSIKQVFIFVIESAFPLVLHPVAGVRNMIQYRVAKFYGALLVHKIHLASYESDNKTNVFFRK